MKIEVEVTTQSGNTLDFQWNRARYRSKYLAMINYSDFRTNRENHCTLYLYYKQVKILHVFFSYRIVLCTHFMLGLVIVCSLCRCQVFTSVDPF